MVTFEVIDNIQQLSSIRNSYKDNGWELDDTHAGLEINDKCRAVSRYYCGRSYIVEALAAKEYSTAERVIRFALGMLATLATLGLALCLQSVRSFFTERKQVICLAVFNKDSGPDHTLCGLVKSSVKAFKVGKACEDIPCDSQECDRDHGNYHTCSVTTMDGKEHNVKLDDIQIRDHLEWLDPAVVKADYSHFAHVGDCKV